MFGFLKDKLKAAVSRVTKKVEEEAETLEEEQDEFEEKRLKKENWI